MTAEEANKLADKALSILGDHFEAVQIHASWTEEGFTQCISRGQGNWYARQGMATEFVSRDRAQEIGREVTKQLPPPPDDDAENWKQP